MDDYAPVDKLVMPSALPQEKKKMMRMGTKKEDEHEDVQCSTEHAHE